MIAKYGCVSDYSYSESPWHGGRKREVLEIYGRTFPCRPVLTVFQGGFTARQDSTTAAFPAIQCRSADGREKEIASRTLASQAQPFCNVQHITKNHPAYYQRHTF